ncbi:hypothetical protein ELH83_35545, partial [Rhizobium leguminosarum]
PELPQSLEQFRDRKRVLIIFADAQDDRALIQDEWLRKAHMRLAQPFVLNERAVVLRIGEDDQDALAIPKLLK